MRNLGRFEINQKLSESDSFIIYRATDSETSEVRILKVLKKDQASTGNIARLREEGSILQLFDSPYVVKSFGFEIIDGLHCLIEEDIGGRSIENVQYVFDLSISEKLEIAKKMAFAISEVHGKNIIHKDINLSNFVMNEDGRIYLIDFGISSRLSVENQSLTAPEVIEGTFAYISPEQTGRMNRIIDYRSDYYSLGASLYRLFSGQYPFLETGRRELIHCHIAKNPKPLSSVVPDIPDVIEAMVAKLMSKEASSRYQTMAGFIKDIDTCINQLQKTGSLGSFEIATNDISPFFKIEEKLYGRDKEVKSILGEFNKVKTNQSKNILFVSGFSGIGKSSVVKEVYRPVTENHAYFISGKFDQYKKDIPFFGIRLALAKFFDQIMMEPNDRVESWKEKLKNLSEDLVFLKEIVPEIENLVTIPEKQISTEMENAQLRFSLALTRLMATICQSDHPLVLFIDDLQWADSSSIDIINTWMTDSPLGNLLIIGAYRDNEIGKGHRLNGLFKSLNEASLEYQILSIKPLNLDHICELLSDSFSQSRQEVESLAEIVLEKTNGNPFFVEQFLQRLADEKILAFSFEKMQWSWDLSKIDSLDVTTNVVDLLLHKLKKLPEAVQNVMSHCAMIGNTFDISDLRFILDVQSEEIIQALQLAIKDGYLVALGDSHIIFQDNADVTNFKVRFKHDRIQQAAFNLLSEERKEQVHCELGRRLSRRFRDTNDSDLLFLLVSHLNSSKSLLSKDERKELAQYNVQAAKKAKLTSAYQSYLSYVEEALQTIGNDSFRENYEFSLEVHNLLIDAYLLTRNFDEMDRVFKVIKNNVQDTLDLCTAVKSKAIYYTAEGLNQDAVTLILNYLDDLGFHLPRMVSKLRLIVYTFKFMWKRGKQLTAENLFNLPPVKDETILAASVIMRTMASPLYYTNKEGIFYCNMYSLDKFILDHGKVDELAYRVSAMGMLFSLGFKNYEKGLLYGEIAQQLLEREKHKDTSTLHLVRFFLLHHHYEFKDLAKSCYSGWIDGLDAGQFEFASYQGFASIVYRLLSSEKIEEILPDSLEALASFRDYKEVVTISALSTFHQLMRNLSLESEDWEIFDGEFANKHDYIAEYEKIGFKPSLAYFTFGSCMHSLIFNQDNDLDEYFKMFDEVKDSFVGVPVEPMTYYCIGLLKMRQIKAEPKKYRKYWKGVKESRRNLKRWSKTGTNNKAIHLHFEAEYAALKKKHNKAQDLFNQAIHHAEDKKFISQLAIIYENFAQALHPRGSEEYQRLILKAHDAYTRWGAVNKVKQIEEVHGEMFQVEERSGSTTATSHRTTNSSLDLQAIIEASQEISAEIRMEHLVKNIMKTLGESAGAELGFLIFPKDGDFETLASFSTGEQKDQYSEAVVTYAWRTGKNVIINETKDKSQFGSDEYLKDENIKSVLCLPIVNSGQVKAIVYLENNNTSNAFTQGRVETLKILASQAAISIENAQLIENLSEKLRMENELQTASLVQATLLPEPVFKSEEIELVGSYEPASECGGDWYYYKDLGDRMILCIADATGHGVPSALVTAGARSAMSVLESVDNLSLGDITSKMNRAIHSCANGSVLMTFFIAILYKDSGKIEFCNASHHEPILLPSGEESYQWQDLKFLNGERGRLLGMDEESEYVINEAHIPCGTKMIFYTDGVSELKNESDQMWGESRFLRCLAKGASQYESPEELMEHINEGIQKHRKEHPLEDDVTYFTVWIKKNKSKIKAA